MGSRKKQMADAIKEAKKHVAFAKLNNCPTSPRKMRLVADLVRGEKVEKALNILRFSQKEASRRLEKLLLSAIANWQAKNEDADIEEAKLYVKEIRVDGGAMLKRLRPAPQGRAHRIRKRSNHVTIVVDALNKTQKMAKALHELCVPVKISYHGNKDFGDMTKEEVHYWIKEAKPYDNVDRISYLIKGISSGSMF